MTKKQAEQKKELRQRISDILSGILGYNARTRATDIDYEVLPQFIKVIDEILLQPKSKSEASFLTHYSNIHHYAYIDSLTNFLWEYGIRA